MKRHFLQIPTMWRKSQRSSAWNCFPIREGLEFRYCERACWRFVKDTRMKARSFSKIHGCNRCERKVILEASLLIPHYRTLFSFSGRFLQVHLSRWQRSRLALHGLIPGGESLKKDWLAKYFTTVNPMSVDQHEEVHLDRSLQLYLRYVSRKRVHMKSGEDLA